MAFSWFQRLFSDKEPEDKVEIGTVSGLEDENPFVFSQHMRIIFAIFITMLSAVVLWWIVA